MYTDFLKHALSQHLFAHDKRSIHTSRLPQLRIIPHPRRPARRHLETRPVSSIPTRAVLSIPRWGRREWILVQAVVTATITTATSSTSSTSSWWASPSSSAGTAASAAASTSPRLSSSPGPSAHPASAHHRPHGDVAPLVPCAHLLATVVLALPAQPGGELLNIVTPPGSLQGQRHTECVIAASLRTLGWLFLVCQQIQPSLLNAKAHREENRTNGSVDFLHRVAHVLFLGGQEAVKLLRDQESGVPVLAPRMCLSVQVRVGRPGVLVNVGRVLQVGHHEEMVLCA